MANDKRLYDILAAASRLFILKGYNEAQIADIARDASISTGTIYSLFASKKAIFHFTLQCIFDPDRLSGDIKIPVGEMEPGDLSNLKNVVTDHYRQFYLANIEPAKMPPFKEMLSNAYDLLSKFGAGFLIFERNEAEWSKMSSVYFQERQQYIENLESRLKTYMEKGEIRPLEHLEYHTRLIIETLAWWCMHRKYDPRAVNLNDQIAKNVVLDALVHAYANK